jgi:hypothetical protein
MTLPTAELPYGYVAWALTTLFLVIRRLQHRPRLPNRCVGQTLTLKLMSSSAPHRHRCKLLLHRFTILILSTGESFDLVTAR